MNPNIHPPKPCYGAPCGWTMPNWCPNRIPSTPVPAPKPFPMPTWNGEYCGRMPAKIRRGAQPQCPMVATIPLLTVATPDNLKGLCNCFVHVDQNNTTYYIDDQHRMAIIWAGPVISDNYDYEENPLGLRSQEVWDFASNRVVKYSATGNYIVINGATE